jgi:hypothetical protein
VTSLGYGEAEVESCGKSFILNKLFKSRFVESEQRNKICGNCPEILVDVYKQDLNDLSYVNLIDIPSNTDIEMVSNIIKHSNLLIIHSLGIIIFNLF